MIEPAVLTLAYILDLAIGDPKQIPHPVRIIGWTITKIEGLLRGVIQNTETREKPAGVFLVLIIVGATFGLFYVINMTLLGIESYRLTFHFSAIAYYLSLLLLVYLISTTLATRELLKSAQSVLEALKTGSIERARKNLSCIVGRDTKPLDNKKILKATIESLAENASDGIIAPLFYFSIGGLPLAMAYKAINTLDSMVGYKSERHKNFGWAAARLDDIVNYIPARITGILIVISCAIVFRSLFTAHCSLKTMLRDGRNHLSPNSGIPEAAMAGALGIRLGGPSFYERIIVDKPYIGEDLLDSSRWFKVVQDGSNLNNAEQSSDSYEQNYLQASEKAFLITRITSVLGFGTAVSLIYLKALI